MGRKNDFPKYISQTQWRAVLAIECSIELSGTMMPIENHHKYLYEALMIDDPLKVGVLFNPLRVGEGFCGFLS